MVIRQEQADDYNNNGLSWSGMRGEAQIGQGVYTAYARDVWEAEDDQWYAPDQTPSVLLLEDTDHGVSFSRER